MGERILLIAQLDGLPQAAAEVQAVVNTAGLQVTLLQSNVTVTMLVEFDWNGHDVVWFAAHGSEQGILIGGEILDITTLAPLLRESDAKLVFINTCSSERLAEQIYAECDVHVVCTVAPTPDLTAFSTARRFIRRLAAGDDYRRAFELSRPGGGRLYRYIPNNVEVKMANQQPDTNHQVDDLVRALTGDRFTGNPGLISELGQLRQELSEYIKRNEEWKHEVEAVLAQSQQFRPLQISPVSAILVTAALILFVSMLFLAVYWLSAGSGVNTTVH